MIWTHGEEHLKTSIGYLNSIYPSIKYTHKYSSSLHQTLPFLDVQVPLINSHIHSNAHRQASKHRATEITPKKPFHSASYSKSAAYVLPTISLTSEAENSSSTLPNVVIATLRSILRHTTLQPKEQTFAKTDRTPFVTSFNPALP